MEKIFKIENKNKLFRKKYNFNGNIQNIVYSFDRCDVVDRVLLNDEIKQVEIETNNNDYSELIDICEWMFYELKTTLEYDNLSTHRYEEFITYDTHFPKNFFCINKNKITNEELNILCNFFNDKLSGNIFISENYREIYKINNIYLNENSSKDEYVFYANFHEIDVTGKRISYDLNKNLDLKYLLSSHSLCELNEVTEIENKEFYYDIFDKIERLSYLRTKLNLN